MSILQAAADVLTELLEVSIHCILYSRKIYPAAAFQRRRKYNIPIQIAAHPQVLEYIESCVLTIHKLLLRNELEKMVLNIIDSSTHQIVEQFVFEVSIPRKTTLGEDSFLLDVEEAARAICLKIATSDAILNQNPSDCTFNVQLHTPESTAMRLSLSEEPEDQAFPWIQADVKECDLEDGNIVPLKSANTDICKVQVYVVESEKRKKC